MLNLICRPKKLIVMDIPRLPRYRLKQLARLFESSRMNHSSYSFTAMLIKTLVVIVFVAIIVSLGFALFHLVKHSDEQHSQKTAKALTLRIGLSLVLFIMLFIALASGLFHPSGIGARIQANQSSNSQPPK